MSDFVVGDRGLNSEKCIVTCQLGGEMRRKFHFPHIWTQKAGRSFDLCWSDQWEHGVLQPLPTDDELTAFYDTENYDHYMQGEAGDHADTRRSLLDRLVDPILFRAVARLGEGEKLNADFVRRHLPLPGRVLDVGCGPALMIEDLQSSGYEVAGVDPSPVALASARARGITMYEATGETMSDAVPRDHFDMVTMSQSLEHTRDPALALRKAVDRLKPGGLVIVEVPNCASSGFRQRGPVWFHTDAGRHINFFTLKSLQEFFRSVSLEPIGHGFSGITAQFTRMQAEQGCWDALYRKGRTLGAPTRPDWKARLSLFFQVLRGTDEARRDMVWVMGRKA